MRQGEQAGAALGPWGIAIGLGLGLLAGIAIMLFAQTAPRVRATIFTATAEKSRKKMCQFIGLVVQHIQI
jgi:hypothetical protein